MKKDQSFKVLFLSVTSIAAIECFIVLVTNDDTSCFWHNSLPGSIISWTIRLILFRLFVLIFTQFFTPAFKTLKERMIERDELEERNKRKQAREFASGKFSYEA
jgi:hypothetical protein